MTLFFFRIIKTEKKNDISMQKIYQLNLLNIYFMKYITIYIYMADEDECAGGQKKKKEKIKQI